MNPPLQWAAVRASGGAHFRGFAPMLNLVAAATREW